MTTGTFIPDFILAAFLGLALIVYASLAQASAFRGEEDVVAGETVLPVLGESVVVVAPRGYCIDRLATLAGPRAAFVLMASCRAITGNRQAARPVVGGLLTASVDGHVGRYPSERELNRYVASAAGLAALSRSGRAEAMELGATFSRDGVFYLHAREHGGDLVLGGQSWRAVFELNGRMVTATFRDLAGGTVSTEAGFRAVEALVDEIRAASPSRREIGRATPELR